MPEKKQQRPKKPNMELLIAEYYDLIGAGKSKSSSNAVILKGYGFLRAGGTDYFCHVKNLDKRLRHLVEAEVMKKHVPEFFPEVTFASEGPANKPAAAHVKPHITMANALTLATSTGEAGELKVLLPGFTGVCVPIESLEDPSGTGGLFLTEIYRAIPTTTSGKALAEKRRYFKLKSTLSWTSGSIENDSEVSSDETVLDALAELGSRHILKTLIDQASHLTSTNATDEIETLLRIPEGLASINRLDAVLKQKLKGSLPSVKESLRSEVYTAILLKLDPAAAAAEAKRQLEAAIDSAAQLLVIDLETDGTTIRELGVFSPTHALLETEKARIEAFISKARDYVTAQPWIGHNLDGWDKPVLALHGLDLSPAIRWDTLRMEALLSPRRPSFALNTSHHADKDAEVTYKLFRNQIIRLLIGGHAIAAEHVEKLLLPVWSSLASVAPYVEQIASNGLLVYHIVALCQTELDGILIQKKPDDQSAIIDQAIQESGVTEGNIHVVFPRTLGPALLSLAEATFVDRADSDLGYEVYPGQEGDLSYEAMLAGAYHRHCLKEGVSPSLAAMPAWSRGQLEPFRTAYSLPAVNRTDSARLIWCIPADYYSRAAVSVPSWIVWVEPDLDGAMSSLVVRTLSRIEIQLFLERIADPWGPLRAARAFWSVSIEQATILLAEMNTAPVDGCRYWVRRVDADRYELIEQSDNLETLVQKRWGDSIAVTRLMLNQGSLPVLQVVRIERPLIEGPQLHLLRLNPETPYRATYWATQTLLLDRIRERYRGKPIVLLVSDRDDIVELENLFFDLDFYVPRGGWHRRLELMVGRRDRPSILVCPLDHIRAVLDANTAIGVDLMFVIDALPLQDAFYVGRNGTETAPEDLSPSWDAESDVLEDEDVDKEGGRGNVSGARFSVSEALRRIAPRLRMVLGEIQRNGADHTVTILDPRVQPIAVDEGFPRLIEIVVPAFDNSTFQDRERIVRARLRSVHAEDEELYEGWLGLLERVFLAGRGQNGQPGRFRDEQIAYLERIMTRREDILVEMPTGGGKSLLFQAPALYHGLTSNRMSVVVTPLKALMADQVDALHRLGFYLDVEFISGDLVTFEKNDIYRRIAGGELRMVYVAPERYRSRGFCDAINARIKHDAGLSYTVFDEAHCISLWGLDFRPDYRVPVGEVLAHRQAETRIPLIMLSATVTEQVYNDLERLLA